MGGVELLRKAREAGLTVEVDGDKLRIRGPKRLGQLALAILDRKVEVFPIVAAMGVYAPPNPSDTSDSDTRLTGDAENGALGTVTTNDDSAPDQWAQRAAGLLATVDDADVRADLRELFEHRAAVCEFDGGLSLTEAERIAFGELQGAMQQWTDHRVRQW